MGCSSYICAKTKKPVLHPGRDYYARTFSRVVVLFPDGSLMRGNYDGYQRVECGDHRGYGQLELLDCMGSPKASPRVVLEAFYAGEKWADLLPNESDPSQWLHSEDEVERLFGMPPEGKELDDWRALRAEFAALEARGQEEIDKVVRLCWPSCKGLIEPLLKASPYTKDRYLNPEDLVEAVMETMREAARVDSVNKVRVDDQLAEADRRGCLRGYLGEKRPPDEVLRAIAVTEVNEERDQNGVAYQCPSLVATILGGAISQMAERVSVAKG